MNLNIKRMSRLWLIALLMIPFVIISLISCATEELLSISLSPNSPTSLLNRASPYLSPEIPTPTLTKTQTAEPTPAANLMAPLPEEVSLEIKQVPPITAQQFQQMITVQQCLDDCDGKLRTLSQELTDGALNKANNDVATEVKATDPEIAAANAERDVWKDNVISLEHQLFWMKILAIFGGLVGIGGLACAVFC